MKKETIELEFPVVNYVLEPWLVSAKGFGDVTGLIVPKKHSVTDVKFSYQIIDPLGKVPLSSSRFVYTDTDRDEKHYVRFGTYRDFLIVQDENLSNPIHKSHVAAKWVPKEKDPLGEALFEIYGNEYLRKNNPELDMLCNTCFEFANDFHEGNVMCTANGSIDLLQKLSTKQIANFLRENGIERFYQHREKLAKIIGSKYAENFLEDLREILHVEVQD